MIVIIANITHHEELTLACLQDPPRPYQTHDPREPGDTLDINTAKTYRAS